MEALVSKAKLRVMVDANVLVAGIAWPRFSYGVLQHAAQGDFRLALSPWIIQEAAQAIARIAPARQALLENLLAKTGYEETAAPSNEEIQAASGLVRDPKDVHVALAAINAGVDYLVTQDCDFTDRDETTEALRRRLQVLLPGTFLRDHMGWSSDSLEAIRNRAWRDLP
jgi:predicted nucleic acid-binding protein